MFGDVDEKVGKLLKVLEGTNLDFNWVLAVTSLSAQEIAIKRKLDELGESYGEEDFQKLAKKLVDVMRRKGIRTPEILLSIARSYRHVRAKIMHNPHKTKLTSEEANAIFYNTEALIKTLFAETIDQIETFQFVESIDRALKLKELVDEYSRFGKERRKQIVCTIIDKISLMDWSEVRDDWKIFAFLKEAIKMESDPTLQAEVFGIMLEQTVTSGYFEGKEKLIEIIQAFTPLGSIKKLIKERKLIDPLIEEFKSSYSYARAGINAQIILNIASLLDNEQANRVVDSALSNDQIKDSYSAKDCLKKFLLVCKDKISKEKVEKLSSVLKK
jgi:hypothetical protein